MDLVRKLLDDFERLQRERARRFDRKVKVIERIQARTDKRLKEMEIRQKQREERSERAAGIGARSDRAQARTDQKLAPPAQTEATIDQRLKNLTKLVDRYLAKRRRISGASADSRKNTRSKRRSPVRSKKQGSRGSGATRNE
jgi:hypothetical protein